MAGKFKDFGKKLGDAAKNTAKKSEELIEIQKTKSKIRDQENEIEKIMKEIGEAAFARHESGEDIFTEAVALCESIIEAKKVIVEYEGKILEFKHIRVCPSCATEIEDTILFCSSCGFKFEPKQEPEPEPDAEPEGNACKSCGAALEEDAVFCSGCGAKV